MITQKYTNISNPYKKETSNTPAIKNVVYGEVVSTEDSSEGGRIRVRIKGEDDKIKDNNSLPYAYPLIPKFLNVYPKNGEIVQIIYQDTQNTQRSRFWIGPVISQLQNLQFDPLYTALSTTNVGLTRPQKAISTFPNAEDVYPQKLDIALQGRDNTDIILSDKKIRLRVGKHLVDNKLERNISNPLEIDLRITNDGEQSSIVNIADKIALISHDGIPKLKGFNLSDEDIVDTFTNGHPLGRGDLIVKVLDLIINVLLNHTHPSQRLKAIQTSLIQELENFDLESILQRNIVIN